MKRSVLVLLLMINIVLGIFAEGVAPTITSGETGNIGTSSTINLGISEQSGLSGISREGNESTGDTLILENIQTKDSNNLDDISGETDSRKPTDDIIESTENSDQGDTAINAFEDKLISFSYNNELPELFAKRLFNNQNRRFELPSEIEAGKDYILSAGDVIKVIIEGETVPLAANDRIIDAPINLSGTITVPLVGTFNARGKNILDMQDEINKAGKIRYNDFNIDISLLKMRSTRIFVMGEVNNPGVSILNPLSSVMNAIYMAGGITDNASLRNIKIIRDDKEINIDLYKYLIYGQNNDSKTILTEGDTIFIPMRQMEASITGEVEKVAKYELLGENSLKDLIKMAGGLKKNADINDIKVIRIDENESINIIHPKSFDFNVADGDIFKIGKINDYLSNGITITGNVFKPGYYEVAKGSKLSDIINKSGGMLAETHMEQVDILSIADDTRYKVRSYSMLEDDPELFAGDNIIIYSNKEVGNINYTRVEGAVHKPGLYRVFKNSILINAIFSAGGIKEENVYMERADIYRLNEDGKISVIKVNLEKALKGDREHNIELKAFDRIRVYTDSEVREKEYVQILGAVKNPGTYELKLNNKKISDIVFEARGVKQENLYMERADIYRLNEDGETFIIGINLEKALNGDSKNDLVLKPYDVLRIYTYDEVEREQYVYAYGEIEKSGRQKYFQNMTLDDLIFKVKPNKITVDYTDIELHRLNKENLTTQEIRINYLEDPKFILQEEDRVFIRRSEEFENAKMIIVSGFVNSPGEYLLQENDNMNTIIERAGGFKAEAAPYGATIIRKGNLAGFMDDLNPRIRQQATTVTTSEGAVQIIDTDKNEKQITNLRYNSGSNLFENDIVLEDGDNIVIPERPTTVKVVGEVFFPREIAYTKGERSLDYYIEAAGGLTTKSYKSRIFVMRFDGTTRRKKFLRGIDIKPGDTIVVPYDDRPESDFDIVRDTREIIQWVITVYTAINLINN